MKIFVRRADRGDLRKIQKLFVETVKSVNSKDYSSEKIATWASRGSDNNFWNYKLNEEHFFVAEHDGELVGFTSITDLGYIDFMYVHKDYQRKGIGRALLNAVEEVAEELDVENLYSHVSITARPFFENFGFIVVEEQQRKINEHSFVSLLMMKKKEVYN
ncbi:MAG TPA: GNAT family N-acetyltransferase [Cytophagaceae bacterium]